MYYGTIKVYIILHLIIQCNGIAKEYYDSMDEHNSSQNEIKLFKINGNLEMLSNNVFSENGSSFDDEQDKDDEFDELKTYVMTETNSWNTTNSMIADADSALIHDSTLGLYDTATTVTPSSMRLIDFFKDYNYEYNEVDLIPSHRRHHNSDPSKVNTALPAYMINSSIETEDKTALINFFNLQPAANIVETQIKKTPLKIGAGSEDTWYVRETTPCWELPMLYAEYGERRPVFAMFEGKLRNVIDMGDMGKQTTLAPETSTSSESQPHNKWCNLEPCYGDHTLCLFPHYQLSKLCDAGYEVLAPTMSEVIALVNTVNSMRNRIASGRTIEYPNLPPAANMQQIIYDYDLQSIAKAWLHQCLPGPAPCSALEGAQVTSLECTKYADKCCLEHYDTSGPSKCVPQNECFVSPIIGCIYIWFTSASMDLDESDVECGHTESTTFSTTQLIWADTYKIGCAYGVGNNADVRVVCNFAPGAPFFLDVKYYCGFIHYDLSVGEGDTDLTDLNYLPQFGLELKEKRLESSKVEPSYHPRYEEMMHRQKNRAVSSDLNKIRNIYDQEELIKRLGDHSNRTRGMIARLVTKYTFYEETDSRCDRSEPMYIIGEPGSRCVERGRRYHDLCYDFRDPTPGYRLIAVLASILLFSVILYDLFSGVVRQTNY